MTQDQPAENLYLRFSTVDDTQAIVEYYTQNRSPFVFLRDYDTWKERISAGAVTIVENEAGGIVASSISYPVVSTDESGHARHKWTEIGSTLIALGGIGLFAPLISAQVLRAHLLETPEDRFVLEIVNDNQRSVDVFARVGAVPFDVPRELFDQVQTTFAEGLDRKVSWYQIGPDSMPVLAKNLVRAMEGAELKSKTDGGRAFRLHLTRMPGLVVDAALRLADDILAAGPGNRAEHKDHAHTLRCGRNPGPA